MILRPVTGSTSCTVPDSGQYQRPRGPVSLHSPRDRDTPHVNLAFQASLRVSSAKGLFALVLSTAYSVPAVCCRWWGPLLIPHSHRRKALLPPFSDGSGGWPLPAMVN